ncbi:MAG TPA: hypothetical protein DEP35_19410 [Deltaproteobacteria bacterium]|nr:hypothetical protein [Deltaproteobacteria bacterium]
MSVGSAKGATIYALTITDGTQTATLSTLGTDESFTPGTGGNGGTYSLISPFSLQMGTLSSWTSTYSDPAITDNFTITNTTGSTQTYTVTVSSPASLASPTQMSGSAGLTLTNGSNASGATLANSSNPVYVALIDGSSVQTLFNQPYTLSCPSAFCSTSSNASFGTPTPISGPGVTSSIGITIQFTLTQGASAGVTSVFNVVPEPTSLALVGAGILALAAVGSRRGHDG